jgi:hypothetical protein
MYLWQMEAGCAKEGQANSRSQRRSKNKSHIINDHHSNK